MREIYLVTLDNWDATPVAAFTNRRKAQRFHRAMGGCGRMMSFEANPPIGPWTTYVAMDRQGDVLERWTRITPMEGHSGTGIYLTSILLGTPSVRRINTLGLVYRESSRDSAGVFQRAQALREQVIALGLWPPEADAKVQCELNREIRAWFNGYTGVVKQPEDG